MKSTASGSNFYYSFLFLPPAQREAISTIYAFCHEVDNIADECSEPSVATQKLNWWSEEITRVFHATPQHPIGQSLSKVIQKYPVQKLWFDELIQGMFMDLHYQGYQTFADLRAYCHCVASSVGMIAATIFGYKHRSTLEYAKQLGLALQIINIIRDIGEDARRGRIYIPEYYLQEFGITAQELLQLSIARPTNFTALLTKMAQQARDYYKSALDALSIEDRALQRSGLIMAKIYLAILEEIELSNFAVLHQKITITPIRKLWIAWRTWHKEKQICQPL